LPTSHRCAAAGQQLLAHSGSASNTAEIPQNAFWGIWGVADKVRIFLKNYYLRFFLHPQDDEENRFNGSSPSFQRVPRGPGKETKPIVVFFFVVNVLEMMLSTSVDPLVESGSSGHVVWSAGSVLIFFPQRNGANCCQPYVAFA
jgi:hypothetical protein